MTLVSSRTNYAEVSKRKFGIVLYYSSLLTVLVGAIVVSKELLAAGTVGVGLGYFIRDYYSRRADSINVMTVYAMFATFFFGFGNLVGYYVENGTYDELFYVYDVREFLFEAQLLSTVGAIIPIIAYDWCKRGLTRFHMNLSIPKIGFETSNNTILWSCLILMVLGWTTQLLGFSLGYLGSLATFVVLGPNLAIFILASRWLSPEPGLPKWSRWIPLCAMVFEAVLHTMFSSMRVRILWPMAAFCLPYIMSKILTVRRIVITCLLVASFTFVYRPLGELRGRVYGAERIRLIGEQLPLFGSGTWLEDDSLDTLGIMTLLARLSTFNQISQVVAIVDEEGLYNGETLLYISYVFIPRIIWPEKPSITPGQWFAEKLGQGTRQSETRFSNAINMTIPGEFYLNFGWIGAILGLSFLGLLYALFWESTTYRRDSNNFLGQVFACLLLMQAMFNGSDVAALVGMALMYVALLAMTVILSAFMKRRQRVLRSKGDEVRRVIQPPRLPEPDVLKNLANTPSH